MRRWPQILSCPGSSRSAGLAAEVAHELAVRGRAEQPTTLDLRRESIAIDGCSSACGFRSAAARGANVVVAVNLVDLDVDVDDADPRIVASRVEALLDGDGSTTQPARPRRPATGERRGRSEPHTVEDYLLVLDRLTSPVVECGVLITDSPTLASHVSEALGVTRAAAGEMLAKMESGGLVRRGPRKELLLTTEGRRHADRCVRRQRLLEVFVTDTLGFTISESFERARTLGPSFDDDAVVRLDRALGTPERCPHGWPLDPVSARDERPHLRTLASLDPGERGKVVCFEENDEAALEQIVEAGIGVGSEIGVEERQSDGGLLDLAGRPITLDRAALHAVYVSA